MLSDRKQPNENFFYSKGNQYDLVDRSQSFAQNRSMTAAESLAHILHVDKYRSRSTRTLRILGNDYQATTVVFTNSDGQVCAPEISVPLDFAGGIRIWTDNRRSKRVWSTVDMLERSSCPPKILFLFLAKMFEEYPEEYEDDIPF